MRPINTNGNRNFMASETIIDDPLEIAEYLIKQHGLKGASAHASQAAYEAQEDGKLYELSIWRDVRRIIYSRQEAAKVEDDQV